MSKASNAREFFNQLPAIQKKFIEEKTISSTMSISKWMSFLGKAAAYDEMSDKLVIRMRTQAIIAFVLAFIFIFISIAFIYAVVIPPLAIIYGITLLKKRKGLMALDLNDYLRKFFLPVLDILAKKAGSDAKVSARLDFRDPKKVQERKKYEANGRKIQDYSQNFIIAKTELLDGSRIEFVISDDFQQQNYTKQSASGKTKYKEKTKTRHVYFLKVTAPKNHYSLSSNSLPGLEIEDLEDSIVIKRKGKNKTSEANHILPVTLFLQGIQEIYEALKAKDSRWTERPASNRKDGDDDEEYDDYDDYDVAMVVWTGTYFDRYDYQSFEHEGTGPYDYSDTDTFFDS